MSNQNNGYIKIHRKILDWQWYGSPNHMTIFIHLLLTANYKDTTWRKEQLKAGQILTGLKQLSAKTGLSIRSVRTVLNDLISTGEVTRKSNNKYSIISITNWVQYQTSDNQADIRATSKRQASDNIQEYKESKKEDIYSPNFEKLWKISKRGSKANAWKEYKTHTKDIDADLIEESLKKYCSENPDKKYQKHLERWIKSRMWELDEQETVKETKTEYGQDYWEKFRHSKKQGGI